jgi:hypothetical protein
VSLSGSRGLVRVSKNVDCTRQTAMVVERAREDKMYELLAGEKYPAEYGERVAARRRGAKFESNLTANNAALLRKALAPRFGYDPEAMEVRNFGDETSGHLQRLARMRRVMQDLRDGKHVPELLIQPQLRLPVGPGLADFEHITPDFAVLDPARVMYVVGEMKSFIVRLGVVDAADLDITRRQAAAEVLALEAEAARVGLADRVGPQVVSVYASPYGLSPASPQIDTLEGEIREVRTAVERMRATRAEIQRMRGGDSTPLVELMAELPNNFRDSCLGSCALARLCEAGHAGTVRVLGDAAANLLGGEFPIARVVALARGASAQDDNEARLRDALRDAAEALRHARPA